METLDVGGFRAAYLDAGRGPRVVFAHCSSATHRAWSFATDAVAETHRALAPDLFGYGRSEPWLDPPARGDASDLDLLEGVVALSCVPRVAPASGTPCPASHGAASRRRAEETGKGRRART